MLKINLLCAPSPWDSASCFGGSQMGVEKRTALGVGGAATAERCGPEDQSAAALFNAPGSFGGGVARELSAR
jgi:hypothetical protein